MKDVEYKISELLVNTVEEQISATDVNLDDAIVNYGIDSVTIIKLIVSIESEFGIEFDDRDLKSKKFHSLRDVVNYVEKKMSLK